MESRVGRGLKVLRFQNKPRFSRVNRKKIRSPIGGLVQFSFHAGLRKSKSSARPIGPPSRPTSPHCRRRGDLTSA